MKQKIVEARQMNELFPILSGLAVGTMLGLIRPQTRLVVAVVAAVVLGTIATVISGEYKIGWEFLLIDIPLVGVSSAAGFVILRAVRRAGAGGAQV
ncbi:MAG TPA: hypothetical protein VFH02_06760 [Jiangellaceae bacterium]|nr:hypothetical protein [Jiangellaceae bacterium]